MKTYARVDSGVVQEIILPRTWGVDDVSDPPKFMASDEQPIELRFTSDFVAQMVDVSNLSPMPESGWVYDGVTFSQPPESQPTEAEVLATQSAKLKFLTQLASSQKSSLTNRIDTLNDAIELEEATPAEIAELPVRQAQLLEWKRYAIYLGRVTGQAGWPPDAEWPVQPTSGMDLAVSAVVTEVQ